MYDDAPPRDYADNAHPDDAVEGSMHLATLVSIAILHLMVGLAAGWLLWG